MKCDILTLETKYHLFIGKRLQLLNKKRNHHKVNRGGYVIYLVMSEILHHK